MILGSHGDRGAEPVHGLHADPQRDDDQRACVDERRQHAGALVAEGSGVVGRAGLEVDGDKAEQESQKIRDVVARFRQQRQRVGAQSGNEGDHDVSERGRQRDAQNQSCPGCALASGRCVEMHEVSVTGGG